MTTPFLPTKLSPPTPRRRLVARPHLIKALNQAVGSAGKMTLLWAPAGFGKTTLVSSWQREFAHPVAWLALDEHDNDPRRFWSYFIAALQRVEPQIGVAIQALLQAESAPAYERLLVFLVNELNEKLTKPRYLVLDDYHLIAEDLLHRNLTFLLEHAPPLLHLLLVSRTVPPLPLARYRARGELAELTVTDLRFDLAETTQFLAETMQLGLTAAEVNTLANKTEGWITGLQLAGLTLADGRNPQQAIAALQGTHRHILAYLGEEVLAGLPRTLQDFLEITAVVEQLCAELCDALTGRQDGQQLLEQLEKQGLFITPLDEEQRWFRYHPLFADLLRQRLARRPVSEQQTLYRRASRWYATEQMLDEAITYALAGQDDAWAVDLVVTNAYRLLMHGAAPTVREWLAALPAGAVENDIRLQLLRIALLLAAPTEIRSDPQLSQQLTALEGAIRQDAAHETERMAWLAELRAHQAMIAFRQRDFESALAYCEDGLRLVTAENKLCSALNENRSIVHGYLTLVQGALYIEMADYTTAIPLLHQAAEHNRRADNQLLFLFAQQLLAERYVSSGDLSRAVQLCEQSIAFTNRAGEPLPVVAIAYLGIAKVARERNQLTEADEYLATAIKLARLADATGTLIDSLITLALLRRAQEQWDSAYAALTEADGALHRIEVDDPVAAMRIGAFRARLQLWQGDHLAAAQWAERYQLQSIDQLPHALAIEYFTLARLLLAQRQPSVASSLLQRLHAAAEQGGRTTQVLEAMILQALAFQQEGDEVRALDVLAQAITLSSAQHARQVRLFADEGQPIAALLAKVRVTSSALQAHLTTLMAACPQPSALLDPLTDREVEIIGLMAAGASNQEIADRLFLTLNTVKWYSSQIYSKLQVRRRTEAVERARTLRLL